MDQPVGEATKRTGLPPPIDAPYMHDVEASVDDCKNTKPVNGVSQNDLANLGKTKQQKAAPRVKKATFRKGRSGVRRKRASATTPAGAQSSASQPVPPVPVPPEVPAPAADDKLP
eukprot:12623294-Alexandrium_andersonii.AAC.1